jgi:hypothetical protein
MSPFDLFDPEALQGALVGLKTATRLSSALGGSGAGLGLGAGLGMLGGGVAGGVQAYRDARAGGASRGEAAGSALGGAGRGAIAGGALGAAGGALGGAAAGALSPGLTEAGRAAVTGARGPVGAFARFGQRQVHGLTGHTPEGGLQAIRHGSSTRRAAVDAAESNLDRVIEQGGKPGLIARLRGQSAVEEASGGVRRANQAYNAGAEAERRGLTSLPGYAKGLVNDPVGTLRAGFRDQWHGMSPSMKALTIAAPAADLMAGAGPEGESPPSALQRAGRAALGVGGMALSPLPQGTQLLLQGLPALAGMSHHASPPPAG